MWNRENYSTNSINKYSHWQFLVKLKMCTLYKATIPLLGVLFAYTFHTNLCNHLTHSLKHIFLNETLAAHIHKEIHTRLSTAALCIKAKHWGQ